MENALPSSSFSILHFQFSILHTPNSNKQQKKSGLPTALLYSEASACALFRAEFDFFALKDHICGAHGAHFTAHRAGMTLGRRNLIIEPLGLFRVECQRELRGPVQLMTRVRHCVIAVTRTGQTECDIAAWAAILLATMPSRTSFSSGRRRCSAGVT